MDGCTVTLAGCVVTKVRTVPAAISAAGPRVARFLATPALHPQPPRSPHLPAPAMAPIAAPPPAISPVRIAFFFVPLLACTLTVPVRIADNAGRDKNKRQSEREGGLSLNAAALIRVDDGTDNRRARFGQV